MHCVYDVVWKEGGCSYLVGIVIIESLFFTIPVMSVHTEDKEVQGVWCCLKERESSYLVGIIIIESLFFTIPVMSVHTEDIKKCNVCLKEWKSLSGWNHPCWKSTFYTIPVMSVHTEDKEVQGVWCFLKEKETCHQVRIVIIDCIIPYSDKFKVCLKERNSYYNTVANLGL